MRGYLLSILRRISPRCLPASARRPRAILRRRRVAASSAGEASRRRRRGGVSTRLRRSSASASPRQSRHCRAQNARKTGSELPFCECSTHFSHQSSFLIGLQRRPTTARRSSKNKKEELQGAQPQACSGAAAGTRQRRKSEQQKKIWTPSAAPTPTAPRRCPAKVPEST